jgi:hypothetical protein
MTFNYDAIQLILWIREASLDTGIKPLEQIF